MVRTGTGAEQLIIRYMTTEQPNEFEKQLADRFAQLPQVVQDAITSADIQKRLRELATAHKLHVDEWSTLENEVMLTILGFQRPQDLEKNIRKETGVSAEDARSLSESINTIVFGPIRQELERHLEHPAAQDAAVSDVEAARLQALHSAPSAVPAAPAQPAVAPATPPQAPPPANVARMPASGAYKPGEASTQRASIVDDPYREPPQ
jgi:hypothetical protein